ncbi:aspartic peptidase domain-containing protein [Poronia punctata]|nr:aspartic peptidase domain-containing protein [Poronia punctata]
MLLNHGIIGIVLAGCVASFKPSQPRPAIIQRVETVAERRNEKGVQHIRAAVQKHKVHANVPSTRRRGDSFPTLARWQREGLASFDAGAVYMLDLEIGVPKQRISLILDTGSYTMLINPDCERSADVSACSKYGYYATTESSTSESLDMNFVANFGTGYMEGVWYNDTIFIGQDELPLQDFRLGVSTWSTYLWAGILGLSYGVEWNTPYPTLLDHLVQLGHIEVPIFSLAVGTQEDGVSEQPGGIIFGGIDRWKFRGYLEPIEIWPNPSDQIDLFDQVGYWVNMTSFGYTQPGGKEVELTEDDFARPMLIDSGSTFTYLNPDLTDDEGVYLVNCDLRHKNGYISFGFNQGNMVIDVSYADFIVDLDSHCALGVQPADDGFATGVLGNSFIRAAYIVFDQMNDAIWLAQYQPCQSDGVSELTTDAGKELWLNFTGLCW